jgi:hypothetical protein
MKQPSVAWPQLEFLIVLSFECAVPEPLCTFTRARASTIYGVPSQHTDIRSIRSNTKTCWTARLILAIDISRRSRG